MKIVRAVTDYLLFLMNVLNCFRWKIQGTDGEEMDSILINLINIHLNAMSVGPIITPNTGSWLLFSKNAIVQSLCLNDDEITV